MKLAFTNDYIYRYASGAASAVGGAERQQWLLGRALARAGWRVVVGVSEGLPIGERATIDHVVFVGIGKGTGHVLSAWYQFLSSERPDWYYWRCASHLLGPVFTITKLLRIRTIFSAALDPDVTPRHALIDRPRCWPLYAWGLSCADRILVQHGAQFENLPVSLKPKAYCVPGIAAEVAAIKPHCKRANYVAWVAQLRQLKRPDLLIDIAHKSPTLKFVVCGGVCGFMTPRDYGERIINALRALPNVAYRGQVPPDQAQQVIGDAALLLSTSDIEGFPNTYVQAWSTGTPIVSLKVDPEQIIQKYGLGTISGNAERAMEDMAGLINSVHRRDEIAARARQFAVENYSESVIVERFQHALAGLR
jgi:glycosyltransferase involved in cell wall biosynthesis